ncbi:MAG: hypothetical protein IRY96_08420, partial [Burkholderiales bacterium]|nr:hypothetical protein [Burkholderiales bacterium]
AERVAAGVRACEGIPTEDLERGAHLFAAAPELAEAAAALLDAALDALTDVQLPASVAERFRAAERKTRAALAKAHGEG